VFSNSLVLETKAKSMNRPFFHLPKSLDAETKESIKQQIKEESRKSFKKAKKMRCIYVLQETWDERRD